MRPLLLFVCAGLTGCTPASQCKQVDSQGKSVVSWAVTARMIATHWTASDLPTPYARKTLSQGERQVRRAVTKLESAPKSAAGVSALSDYRRLADLLGEMTQAVQGGDRQRVRSLALALPQIQQDIANSRSRCQAEKE